MTDDWQSSNAHPRPTVSERETGMRRLGFAISVPIEDLYLSTTNIGNNGTPQSWRTGGDIRSNILKTPDTAFRISDSNESDLLEYSFTLVMKSSGFFAMLAFG
jgi:hypothetical protein